MFAYAIRNKITGLYLENGRVLKRTIAEFGTVPRLFNKKGAATNAMKAWVQGVWTQSYDPEWGPEGPEPPPPSKKPEDRKLEDLEVVTFELAEVVVCPHNQN